MLLRQIEFPTEIPLKLSFELDRRVLFVGLAAATASAVLASLIPAWQTTRSDLVSTMKNLTAAPRRSRTWGRHSLVCVQVALSLILLTIATSVSSDFDRWVAAGPGYRTDGIFMMRFDDRLSQLDAGRTRQFYRLLTKRAAAIPGVTSVALSSFVPLKVDTSEAVRIAPEGVELPNQAADVNISSSRIDEGFFAGAR